MKLFKNSKIKNYKIILATLFISCLFVLPKSANAGLIIRTPSSLGLTSGLSGHWSFDANTFSVSTLFAVNSAGSQYSATDGIYYEDDGYSGGGTASTEDSIANTTDDTLYQSERYGEFSYDIPVGAGTYSVTLKFAEIYWESAAQRVFDVAIEGVTVLNDFDIYAVAGHDTAYDQTFSVNVSDGTLNIEFTNEVDNAKVSAIKIAGLGILDLSANALTGTVKGGVKSYGKLGQGFSFNGTSDSISFANTTFAGDFTISAWVKSNNLSSYNAIVGKEGSQNYIAISSTGAHWLVGNSYSNVLNSAFNTTNWQYVTFVRSGSNILVYRNGIYVGQNEGYSAATLALTSIGAGDDDLSPPHAYFMNGLLDDVRIYNRALTITEIQRLYNVGAGTKVNKSSGADSNSALRNGLIAHITLDGDSMAGVKAYDKSGSNNTGTMSGSPAKAAGKIGQGLRFDGNDDYIVLANESNFDFDRDDPFSMAVWLKSTPGDTSIQQIIGKAADYTPYAGIHLFKNYDDVNSTRAGSLSFVINSAWGDDNRLWVYATAATPINDGNWHYYIITYNGSSSTSGMKIYQDGSLLATSAKGSLSNSILNDIAVGIGARGDGSPQYHENFNGIMDDVRIYNRELSASEVKLLYNLGVATKTAKTISNDSLASGLVGHWTFDGTKISGAYALDSSSNNNTGTITGATKVAGKIGQALNFDGSNVVTTSSDFIGTGAVTITAWVKPRSGGGNDYGRIVTNEKTVFGYSPYGAGNRFRILSDGSTEAWSAVGSLPFNQWTFVVATRDSNGVANLYANGVLSGTANQNSGTPVPGTINVCIGGRSSDALRGWNGSIDDVRIYNRVLTTEEIKRLYLIGR